MAKPDLLRAMKELVTRLDELYEWDKPHLEAVLNQQKDELKWKPRDYFMPIRLICTGREDSPPLVESLVALGREMTRFRIRDACQRILR